MLKKISTAVARKKFANIINRVAFGKESFVLTRHGRPLVAIVAIEDLRRLQELEEQKDTADALRDNRLPGEDVTWEQIRDDFER